MVVYAVSVLLNDARNMHRAAAALPPAPQTPYTQHQHNNTNTTTPHRHNKSLDHTLTQGIVSGTGREIGSASGRPIQDVIQTDAAINPGNSGGPLLDSSGCLIGARVLRLFVWSVGVC